MKLILFYTVLILTACNTQNKKEQSPTSESSPNKEENKKDICDCALADYEAKELNEDCIEIIKKYTEENTLSMYDRTKIGCVQSHFNLDNCSSIELLTRPNKRPKHIIDAAEFCLIQYGEIEDKCYNCEYYKTYMSNLKKYWISNDLNLALLNKRKSFISDEVQTKDVQTSEWLYTLNQLNFIQGEFDRTFRIDLINENQLVVTEEKTSKSYILEPTDSTTFFKYNTYYNEVPPSPNGEKIINE